MLDIWIWLYIVLVVQSILFFWNNNHCCPFFISMQGPWNFAKNWTWEGCWLVEPGHSHVRHAHWSGKSKSLRCVCVCMYHKQYGKLLVVPQYCFFLFYCGFSFSLFEVLNYVLSQRPKEGGGGERENGSILKFLVSFSLHFVLRIARELSIESSMPSCKSLPTSPLMPRTSSKE